MQKQRKTSNATTSEIVLESLREQIINGILQPQEKLVGAVAQVDSAEVLYLPKHSSNSYEEFRIILCTKDVQSHCFLHKTLMKSFCA